MPNTLVWKDGLSDWVPASDHPELESVLIKETHKSETIHSDSAAQALLGEEGKSTFSGRNIITSVFGVLSFIFKLQWDESIFTLCRPFR